jgi:hypothetical protein
MYTLERGSVENYGGINIANPFVKILGNLIKN